ncbi:hypothetical protein AVEN_231940-1 [Araneus ventricosus]|uniref:Uncharacterized protein n=1 Tax=Araneus ventricosus TaxID=182803 RepID=A0A4Y2C0V4_ARAVE|nr:hypothetical protein AVEN_231940-1 [Araneus ventricosus]
MTASVIGIVRKLPSFPNTSGQATLTKKTRAAGVKSITLYERRWEFQSDIRTFWTAIVFCSDGRMARFRIYRVKIKNKIHPGLPIPTHIHPKLIRGDLRSKNGDVIKRSRSSMHQATHSWRIFRRMGFRGWNPQAPKQ